MTAGFLKVDELFEERCRTWWEKAVPEGSSRLEVATERAQLLATAARSGEVLGILLDEFGVSSAREGLTGGDPPLPPRLLTAQEITAGPSLEFERQIHQSLGLVPAAAVRSSFWMALLLWWWEERYILDGWATEGRQNWDDDKLTRFIGWRLGGLSHVQGSVSVFECPIARAWWRPLIADRAADGSDGFLTPDRAQTVLRDRPVWIAVTGVLVRRLAALNHPRALAAALLSFEEEPPSHTGNVTKNIMARRRLEQLGRWAPVVDFSAYPLGELIKMCSGKGVR